MVLLRMSAVSALLTSAAFIGQHSNSKNAKIEWDKKKAFNSIVPAPKGLQSQKHIQPLDADEFDPKTLSPAELTEKTDLLLLGSHKKANSKKAGTLQLLKPVHPAGSAGNVVVPIYQKPDPDCAFTPSDATMLAKIAMAQYALISIQNERMSDWETEFYLSRGHLPDTKLFAKNTDFSDLIIPLIKKVKTPWDIQTANRAICQVLDEANINADPDQFTVNNQRALFLKKKIEEHVINESTRTWLDKLCLLKAQASAMSVPDMMMSTTGIVSSLKMLSQPDGNLKQKDARLLAESFILNQPLKNRPEKMSDQVIGFKDLVLLEGEAIQVLEKAIQNAKSPLAKTQLAMNFIAMSHDVAIRHAMRARDTSWVILSNSDRDSEIRAEEI
jgi:hypothetical protein